MKEEEFWGRPTPNPDEPEFSGLVQEVPDSVDFGAPRVRLKWYTPQGDKLVAHMARVSNPKATLDDPAQKLIGFLIRNHHWSPFEMVNLCLEIHTERDISAQVLRHSKEFRFQEFSTRYAEVEDLRWSIECRFQDSKNRQNSFSVEEVAFSGVKLPIDAAKVDGPGDQVDVEQVVSYWDALVNETRTRSLEGYRWALEHGVAKECARRVLPIGLMPTVMYINSNLRGWIHYLAERTKPGVQKEHREIALAVEPIFEKCFPLVWQAVLNYRAEAERKEQAATNWQTVMDMLDSNLITGIDPLEFIENLITDFANGPEAS